MTPIRSRAIITGNPNDGFDVIGPFEAFEGSKLTSYAETIGDDWWIVDLIGPDEEQS